MLFHSLPSVLRIYTLNKLVREITAATRRYRFYSRISLFRELDISTPYTYISFFALLLYRVMSRWLMCYLRERMEETREY